MSKGGPKRQGGTTRTRAAILASWICPKCNVRNPGNTRTCVECHRETRKGKRKYVKRDRRWEK